MAEHELRERRQRELAEAERQVAAAVEEGLLLPPVPCKQCEGGSCGLRQDAVAVEVAAPAGGEAGEGDCPMPDAPAAEEGGVQVSLSAEKQRAPLCGPCTAALMSAAAAAKAAADAVAAEAAALEDTSDEEFVHASVKAAAKVPKAPAGEGEEGGEDEEEPAGGKGGKGGKGKGGKGGKGAGKGKGGKAAAKGGKKGGGKGCCCGGWWGYGWQGRG